MTKLENLLIKGIIIKQSTPKTMAINAFMHVCLGIVYFTAIMGLFALLFGFSL